MMSVVLVPCRTSVVGLALVAGVLVLSVSVAAVYGTGRAGPGAPRGGYQTPVGQAPPGNDSDEELAWIGEELAFRVCDGECHRFDRIIHQRRAPFEWAQLVVDMESRGAEARPHEFAVIGRFLTRYYGLLMVNRASARDLSAVLGLSDADAEAIVAYRAEHGSFPNLEALLDVPGINRILIEEQPDALRFN